MIIGVQERRQPLPVGRYWLTVISSDKAPQKLDDFRAWAASNPQRITIEHSDAGDLTSQNGAFFIFKVLQPTRFDQVQFGFPNLAGPEVQTSADTAQRPPTPKVTDILPTVPSFLPSFEGLGSWVLLLGIAYLLTKGKK